MATRYIAGVPIREDHQYWRMGEMLSDTNTLERPFNWRLKPTLRSVELYGDLLVWRPDGKEPLPLSPQQSDVGLLHQFVRFCEKNTPVEEILKFARKWGVLGLCQHLLPMPHHRLDLHFRNQPPCQPFQLPTGEFFEALEFWRNYSRRARATLRIASRLNQNMLGDFEDWRVLDPSHKPLGAGSIERLLLEKSLISNEIQWWLWVGKVAFLPDWSGKRLSVNVSCNLVGLIGCHMMFAVSRSQGIAICTSCGFPYAPKRRPAPNKSNYCPPCRETSPSRESKARARSKRRESK